MPIQSNVEIKNLILKLKKTGYDTISAIENQHITEFYECFGCLFRDKKLFPVHLSKYCVIFIFAYYTPVNQMQ